MPDICTLLSMTSMTVIVHDAVGSLAPDVRERFGTGSLEVLLYADDTLLLGSAEGDLQALLDAVSRVGAQYGMELHWSKFQLIELNATYNLVTPGGERIAAKDFLN